MSFRTRVAWASAAAVAVVVVVAALGSYTVARRALTHELDRSLAALAEPVQRVAGPDGVVRPFDGPLDRRRLLARDVARALLRGGRFGGAPGFVQLVSSSGEVRVVTGQAEAEQLPVTDAALAVASGTSPRALETVDVGGNRVRVLTIPLGRGAAAQVARPLAERDAALGALARRLLLGSLAALALAWVAGQLVAERAVRPVTRLTEASERIARTQDLSHRIDVAGEDEIARLAASFNAMLASLETARRAQRQLVADASHELRTPLTSLRTNIEVLESADRLAPADRRALIGDVRLQLEELSRLVAALVELARGDAPVADPVTVRLDELAEAAVARARALHRGATIELDAPGPCPVPGRPDRIERAIANLVDNAVKHAGAGGPVEVTVSPRAGGGAAVSVRDHGPGIDRADLPHVFDRFYRAPAARGLPGSGLGLAIVRQVAEAHGGEATAGPAPGGGSVFTLHLPGRSTG